MSDLGRTLVVVGGLITFVGLLLMLAPHVPGFGRLPGDLLVQRERFTFYFPLATCLVVSVVVTLVLNLLFRN